MKKKSNSNNNPKKGHCGQCKHLRIGKQINWCMNRKSKQFGNLRTLKNSCKEFESKEGA